MAHDDERLSARENEQIDEWVEYALRERPREDDARREPPVPPLIQELQQSYQAEAQAIERRIERVRRLLDQRAPAQRSGQEPLLGAGAAPVSPDEREHHPMRNPLSRLHAPRRWATRLSALAAVALLVVLVGGLTVGLILVRHGGTAAQSTPSPTAASTAIPTPTPTPAGSANVSITSIAMKDAESGWATGYPNPFTPGVSTHILHTSDGGLHWQDVTPKGASLLAQISNALARPLSNGASVRTEDFLTGSVAWVLSLPNQFFVTSDGGQTWQQKAGPGGTIRQFTFLDAQNGWVITQVYGAVLVFRTTDGGVSWTRALRGGSPFSPQDAFWGVSFLNTTTGWAAYINNTAGSSATIYMTRDGGATWQRQRFALPPGVIGPVFVAAPIFFNDHEGIMEVMFAGLGHLRPAAANLPASGGGAEALYVTHDGGATWQGPMLLTGLEFPDFIDALHGWALNSTGSGLLTTSDSGLHWTDVQTSPNFNQMSDPNFVSSEIGWAIRYDPAGSFLLKTEDGGQTWTQLPLLISN